MIDILAKEMIVISIYKIVYRRIRNMRGAQPYTKYLPVRELEDGPISLSLVENLWILLLIIFSELY